MTTFFLIKYIFLKLKILEKFQKIIKNLIFLLNSLKYNLLNYILHFITKAQEI